MVAEWIDGMTLADYLQTELLVHQLRRVAIELAEAVAYVHQQQVVHRDLKPSNVIVTPGVPCQAGRGAFAAVRVHGT